MAQTYTVIIAKELGLNNGQVSATLNLLEEGATIPVCLLNLSPVTRVIERAFVDEVEIEFAGAYATVADGLEVRREVTNVG